MTNADALHRRARLKGVNPIVYWLVRAVLQPFFHLYFRLSRIGREHIPQDGPVIFAANHRSFLDPFVIATMARRPIYYVAKKELFRNRLQAWLLNSLGAFPVDRGNADKDTFETARAILARGDCVLIFPEGTRVRPGPPGKAKRGVGRLALETGVPVVPVAVIGTTDIRKGWRIRPRKVRIRAGRPLTFPRVETPSRELAAAVTERIWPCVMLQWEWLGGATPLRRAAIIGAGAWGTGLAVALARAGLDVDLGCRSREQAETLRRVRTNERYLPGVELPERVRVSTAAELELSAHDLVCLAVPARDLPAALAAHGARIPNRAGVLVVSKGLVAPLGTLPSVYAAERVHARAVAVLAGPSHAAAALAGGASIVLATQRRRVRAGAGDRAQQRRIRRPHEPRRSRRRARRLREERGSARGCRSCCDRWPERRRRRRRQGLRRDRRARALAWKCAADVRRPRRRRRPRRDRRRRRQPQPPRRRAARPGHVRRADRSGARPVRRGGRQRPAACRDAARREPVGDRDERARGARRGAHRPAALERHGHPADRVDPGRPARPENGDTAHVVPDPEPASKADLDRSFSELYRTHLRDVYSYSYYRVGNHHDAEDLTEQTFLQAYRHYERALRESDGRPLRPWLIRIAHNLAANFYRDRARKPESAIEDAAIISAPHTTEALVEGREELEEILAGVRQLPDDRREALIMRFALGMDNREIARALGRTDGATKVLLHRAIKQLEGIVAEPQPSKAQAS